MLAHKDFWNFLKAAIVLGSLRARDMSGRIIGVNTLNIQFISSVF